MHVIVCLYDQLAINHTHTVVHTYSKVYWYKLLQIMHRALYASCTPVHLPETCVMYTSLHA